MQKIIIYSRESKHWKCGIKKKMYRDTSLRLIDKITEEYRSYGTQEKLNRVYNIEVSKSGDK